MIQLDEASARALSRFGEEVLNIDARLGVLTNTSGSASRCHKARLTRGGGLHIIEFDVHIAEVFA